MKEIYFAVNKLAMFANNPPYALLKDNNIQLSEDMVVIFTDFSWNDCIETGRSTG